MVESSKDDAASVSNTKNDPATWEIKEIVLVVPAFATALAIVYDVGFFMEIDLSFFSFFSLSEHIVFAIQASIPVAILIISVVFALFVGPVVMGELITLVPVKAIGKARRITLMKGWHWFVLGILLIVLGVLVVVVIRQALEKQIYAVIPVVPLIVIIGIKSSSNSRAPLVMVMLISGVLITALLLGTDYSRHAKFRPTNSHQFTIDNAVVEGNLVLSGERGVLFYHATSKQYRLVQWNRITEVRAKADDENW